MADKNSAWRSPWVIGWVAMVVTFLSMNLFMVYMAIDTSPGLVVDDFYDRGQDYEKHMLDRQARDPGWQMQVSLPRKIPVGEAVLCRFNVKDRQGHPVTPDSVTFYAYRPSNKKDDFSVPMHRVAPGVYEAKVSFPLIGAWDTLTTAKRGKDEYYAPKRLGVGIDWAP